MPYDNARRKLWAEAGYQTDMGSAAADMPPPSEYIRLYHLTSLTHAINNIAFSRIKVSRFFDLNDPFELLAISDIDSSIRDAVQAFQSLENSQTGLICFSEDWTSPVMWSHYAEKHRGVCLGFDVLRTPLLRAVDYEDKRSRVTLGGKIGQESLSDEYKLLLLRTKFSEWAYEREQRLLVPLARVLSEGTLHFRPFDVELRLAEVILGQFCPSSIDDVRCIVQRHAPLARTFRSRLAGKHFKVVPVEDSVP